MRKTPPVFCEPSLIACLLALAGCALLALPLALGRLVRQLTGRESK